MSSIGHIKIRAVLENLQAIMDCVTAAAAAAGFSARRIGDMELAVEEAVTNVFKYASPLDPGEIEVACACGKGRFSIEIRDSGREFDITKLPSPDLSQGISDRPIGGLGAYLIMETADDVTYRRLPGFNVLTLSFDPEIKKS